MRARATQIKDNVLASVRQGTGHSGMPLIYGIGAAAEVAALKSKATRRGKRAEADGAAMSTPGGEVRRPSATRCGA